MTIKQITTAPPDIHAWYVEKGRVYSEPVLVFALITGRGQKNEVKPLVMGNTGEEELLCPRDKGGFLGIGSLKDQDFWESLGSKIADPSTSKVDGTDKLCWALYRRRAQPRDFLGGSDARMLYDAAEEIEKYRTKTS